MNASLFISTILISAFTFTTAMAHAPPDDAKVFFVNLKNGDNVTSPFQVVFGINGFGITPAGTKTKRKHVAGHHHLLVNIKKLPDMDEPLPHNPNIIHFDKGERETILKLPAGKHTLQMLLADEEHEPHEPPLLSEKITITVK